VKFNLGLPWQEQHLTGRVIFSSEKIEVKFKKKLVKCYIWNIALYDAETWILREKRSEIPRTFKMCFWRRVEKISWTDRVRNEEVLHKVKKDRNILHKVMKKC
jgi:hypothetical protein